MVSMIKLFRTNLKQDDLKLLERMHRIVLMPVRRWSFMQEALKGSNGWTL